ncbi:DJ-1/PfpI family protein [Robertmurraya sp. Marseille-Q9965]
MKIQIVLFDGFDLLDAIAPYEVFTAAGMYTNEEIIVKFVSAEGERMVTSGVNHVTLQAVDKLDLSCKGIILVPGASGSIDLSSPDSIPMKLKHASETELSDLLKASIQKPDILLSTVCGGSLILAMAGLLEGRHAVTHHMGMDLLSATNAIPVNARIVDDGNLVTGGGVTSGIDVALYLVERVFGPRIAHAVEQLFEYERRGTVWKNEGNSPIVRSLENSNEDIPLSVPSKGTGNFLGKWETTISTPIGKLAVLLDLTSKNGKIVGTATQGEETVTLDNLLLEGNQLTWSMKVTKPMRLSLKFSVSIDRDQMMYGEVKAGILPASKLTGQRIS